MTTSNTVALFGLGKLGASTLAVLAEKNFDVIGVDVNQDNVDAINEARCPVSEPQVTTLLQNNKWRYQATTDGLKAVKESLVAIVIVPTPSEPNGNFSNKYIEDVLRVIGTGLKEISRFYTVVITSTVLPGSMEQFSVLLEEISGRKCGVDFGLVYNPDFIALGSIVKNLKNPDMILIGESDILAGSIVEGMHERITENDPPVFRMSFYNAELAKISLNTYCVMKINFANTIAEICESMPAGNADIVLGAIGADSRIGAKYFRPGLSAVGPCFGRDSRAFVYTAKKFDVDPILVENLDASNTYQTDRIIAKIREICQDKYTLVSILGLSYKINTPVIEESVGVKVAKELVKAGINVKVYDPQAMDNARKELGDSVTYANDVRSALSGSLVSFIATDWDEFKRMPSDYFEEGSVVIDAWGLVPPYYKTARDMTIIRIGRAS
jgi:UDPglucose 6-dehydrogenase